MLIEQCDANIIALTETWLNVGNENSDSIKGYNFVSKCSVVSRGGGVGFFVSDNISFKIIDLVSLNIIVTSFEILLLKIVQRRSSDIYVAVVYRHPDCNMKVFNLEFFNFSNYFSNRLSFILGDFNVDLLTASSLQSSSQFYNNVASCSLLPVFTKPTRITSNSQSIIDNIFTNFPLHNCLPKILVVDISDHFPIFLQIPIKFDHSNSKTKQTRLYDINCKNKFHNLLSSCDWSTVLNDCVNDDPCSAYTNFISIYSRL